MADDPNAAPAAPPSTLDKLAALVGRAALYIPVAGQYVQIAEVGLEALAAFLDQPGQDKSALDSLHAQYLARIAKAKDPTS